MRLDYCATFCLLAFLAAGCGGRYDPYGRQVNRALDASIQGEECFSQGELQRAEKAFQKSLGINRSIDNPSGTAIQLNNLGALALARGDAAAARDLFQRALDMNQDLGNRSGAATNLANLATVAQKVGDLPKAEQYLTMALQMAQQARAARVQGQVLCQAAGLALDQQDTATAAGFLEQARGMAQDPAVQGAWNYQHGRLALSQGNAEGAVAFFSQALAADRKLLQKSAMAADLLGLAEAWELRGDPAQSFQYYARSSEVYAALGNLAKVQTCLTGLRRVNAVGNLGRSLHLYKNSEP
ncbi:tetratricopeptide repeat protein [Desulfobacca acetoxidans]